MPSAIDPLVVPLSSYLKLPKTRHRSRTSKPSRREPALPCWYHLSQANKLRAYGSVLPALSKPLVYVTVNLADARLAGLKGGWWTFPSRIWRWIRKAVFDSDPHEPTYVWALDITDPKHLLAPGTLCVNPDYGFHLNLALHLPDHLLPRLESFLEKLNRKMHRSAAKVAARRLAQIPGIRRRRSGTAVYIRDVYDPVWLVAGYFADRLDQALRIAKRRGLSLPTGKRVQLAFASADIREAAKALYGQLKASRRGRSSAKAVRPPSVAPSAATCHSRSTATSSAPATTTTSFQAAAASSAIDELDAMLRDLENTKLAVPPAHDLQRGFGVAPGSPSRGQLNPDGPAICPGRALERPPAASRQASSSLSLTALPGPFQGSCARPGDKGDSEARNVEIDPDPLEVAGWLMDVPAASELSRVRPECSP